MNEFPADDELSVEWAGGVGWLVDGEDELKTFI